MLEEVGQFISTVGFPVAVAGFLLYRMNGKIDKLRESIEKLIHALEQHATKED